MAIGNRHCKNQGFSLAQISMVLLATSIIFVSTIPGGQGGRDEEKIRVTREHMEAIEAATANFMAKNLRRPCPADGSQPLSSATYGAETGSPGDCAGGAVFRDPNINIAVGTVPTKALGLAPEYGLDGYGRHIMYFIDVRATVASSSNLSAINTCQDLQNNSQHGELQVANNFSDLMAKDYVMWALVSYGKDGNGAFAANGSAQDARINTSSSNDNTLHNALQYTFAKPSPLNASVIVGQRVAQASPAPGFDDVVWYLEETKNTCYVGQRGSQGFRISRSGANLAAANASDFITAKGDFNGDGIDDLAVTLPNMTSTASRKVYVIYGRKTGWPGNLSVHTADNFYDLDTMATGDTGFTISAHGSAVGGHLGAFGGRIAVGDMNNDKFDDLIISSGKKIFIVFGNATKSNATYDDTTASVSHSSSPTTSRVVIDSVNMLSANTAGGMAVGDVNGDGYKDLVFAEVVAGVVDSVTPKAYVVFGRASASWPASGAITVSSMPASGSTHGFRITTTDASPSNTSPFAVGEFSVAVGDVNGDHRDDIVFGGQTARPNDFRCCGKVYVLFGKNGTGWGSGAGSDQNVRTLATNVTTGSEFNIDMAMQAASGTDLKFGQSVAVADVNNDGIADIIASGILRTYVYYGRTTGWPGANYDLSSAIGGVPNASITFVMSNSTASPASPMAISVGDINGDGKNDIAFGDPTKNGNAGQVDLVFGPTTWSATTPYVVGSINRPAGRLVIGPGAGYSSNSYVFRSQFLDINNDGKLDMALSLPAYHAGANGRKGAVILYLGRKDVPWQDPTSLPGDTYDIQLSKMRVE